MLKQQRIYRRLAEVRPLNSETKHLQVSNCSLNQYQQTTFANDVKQIKQKEDETVDSALKKICGGYLDDLENNSISDNSSDDEHNSIDLRKFQNFNRLSGQLSTDSKVFGMDKDPVKPQSDYSDDDVDDDVFGNVQDKSISF